MQMLAACFSSSSLFIFCFVEEVVCGFEGLGNDADFAHARHEVRIAIPTGDDVPVEVAWDSSSPGRADVESDIKSIGVESGLNPGDGVSDELVDFEEFSVGKIREVRGVLIGSDHEVTACVGVAVKYDKGMFSAVEDKVFAVVGLGGKIDENTAGLVGRVCGFDVIESPRCPKLISHIFILADSNFGIFGP